LLISIIAAIAAWLDQSLSDALTGLLLRRANACRTGLSATRTVMLFVDRRNSWPALIWMPARAEDGRFRG
jgi:hypothetical protein